MTSSHAVQETLQKEIIGLPEQLAAEVLDFVQFLKARRAEDRFLWEQVEATRAYRQQHPEDVRTATVDEWLAETSPEASSA